MRWVDIGCGDNAVVADLGNRAEFAVGVDAKIPQQRTTAPFVCANLNHLPLQQGAVDFVTLRFVIEHLKDVPKALLEIERIMKPKGKFVVITTNSWSPFVFLPRILPFRLKKKLLMSLYEVEASTIQRTYHRFNSVPLMRQGIGNLKLIELRLIQDVNYVRRWLFWVNFIWHMLTKMKPLRYLRTCIFAVYVQSEE